MQYMIVLDASTAILLAKVELLDRFTEKAHQPVVMPREVERECYGHPESFDAQLIARAIAEKRVAVQVVRQRKLYEKLRRDFTLGPGEAAAIALAQGAAGAVVATDDRLAIQACKLLKIPFTTALAVLVRMREKGLLTTAEATLKLEMLARYGRYKRGMIEAARVELEGKQR
jgi:predicted nucleic acid-binding protein